MISHNCYRLNIPISFTYSVKNRYSFGANCCPI